MYASLFPLPGPYSADGKMTWLLDLNGYSRKNSPPIRMALQTLHILQNHFPERLGLAVCYQTPLVFECETGRGMVLNTEWCRVLNRLRSLARSFLHQSGACFQAHNLGSTHLQGCGALSRHLWTPPPRRSWSSCMRKTRQVRGFCGGCSMDARALGVHDSVPLRGRLGLHISM